MWFCVVLIYDKLQSPKTNPLPEEVQAVSQHSEEGHQPGIHSVLLEMAASEVLESGCQGVGESEGDYTSNAADQDQDSRCASGISIKEIGLASSADVWKSKLVFENLAAILWIFTDTEAAKKAKYCAL